MLVLDILKSEKAAFAIVLFPIQNIPDEGHYLFRKQVGFGLTETENWDLLVDCTSRGGRKMLDAGVHLSHKHTLLMKKHSRFKNSTKYSTESASALTNGEETTDSIISKMLSNLSCLVSDRSSVMKKSNTLFNERRENI